MDPEARNAQWLAEYTRCERHLRISLRRWCLGHGYTLQDYEDAVQFACMNTLEHWDKFDGQNFVGWAFKCATNHARWGRHEEAVDTISQEGDSEFNEVLYVPLPVMERGNQKRVTQVRLKENAQRPTAPRSQIIFDLLSQLDKRWYKTRRLKEIVVEMSRRRGLGTSFKWHYYEGFLEIA